MELEIRRCKHCKTSYYYQASGAGCFDEANDMEYCPDCMRLINDVLKSAPIKYAPRYDEYTPSDALLSRFEGMREGEKENIFPTMVSYKPEMASLDYDGIRLYVVDHVEYAECFNSVSDKHYFILREYDLINECFTDRVWRRDTKEAYYKGGNLIKMLNKTFGNGL